MNTSKLVVWLHKCIQEIHLSDPSIDALSIEQVQTWVSNLSEGQLRYAIEFPGIQPTRVWKEQPLYHYIVKAVISWLRIHEAFPEEAARLSSVGGDLVHLTVNNETRTQHDNASVAKETVPTDPDVPTHQPTFPLRFEKFKYPTLTISDPQVQTLIHTLNTIQPSSSPLTTLHHYLTAFFAQDLSTAAFALEHFRTAISAYAITLPPPNNIYKIVLKSTPTPTPDDNDDKPPIPPWFISPLLTSSILALSAPRRNPRPIFKTLLPYITLKPVKPFEKFTKESFVPCARLLPYLLLARNAAKSEGKKTSILHVRLEDTGYYQQFSIDRERMKDVYPFDHHFALGIGPEGMRIWSSFALFGPRLDQWISGGGARVRSWDEAERWVREFDVLVGEGGVEERFDRRRRRVFRRLLGVDLGAGLGEEGRGRVLGECFLPWVGVEVVEGIEVGDVRKFVWVVKGEGEGEVKKEVKKE
ncbi:hypothetical protein B0J11DRAFT_595060 [Dendryphion nanum]|uniref:Uncharacterized protein n=1 Tax=Dendryphion nanum TaxID=256645 RepID=A0A9P9IB63_9PLEO|nr:hypothetical protein B0J11DRAFT_595060 [Dendryphion nanum]